MIINLYQLANLLCISNFILIVSFLYSLNPFLIPITTNWTIGKFRQKITILRHIATFRHFAYTVYFIYMTITACNINAK
ncbi:hypothetical protein C1645_753199 [Glomus cerebriforme]|uniref:Uncharacterized protein n=1 Tax=Glomus cerebriforme TaxID=658196 RepID=A0A397TG48_9GLOM|nr:hypothetical protein C1645_753199 [Glomus cerebriforme]